MTQTYVEQHADLCPIALLRAPIVYGPRDTEMYAFFKSMGRVYSQSWATRKHVSLIYVGDLCKALMLLAEHDDAERCIMPIVIAPFLDRDSQSNRSNAE